MLFKITMAIHKRHCRNTEAEDTATWQLPGRLEDRFYASVCLGALEKVAVFTCLFSAEPRNVKLPNGALSTEQMSVLANSSKEYLLFDWFVEPVS